MDSQTPKMPEITVEQRDEKEKKRSGLLGFLDLFGKGGGGFTGALGGAGAGGGLLATKAGLIGLILVGSTLAGGIGVVGYKAFGPGSNGGDSRYSSIFAQKSAAQIAAEEAADKAAAAANGESSSLSDLAKANSGAMGAPQQPGAADAANPADKTKQDASAIADAAKAASAGKGKDNNTNIGGNKAASLKSDHKIGELSKLGGAAGGGGGGSGASFSTAGHPGPQTGKLSGFGGNSTPSVVKGGAPSRARKLGAFGQALKASQEGKTGTSMQGAGATFDGNGAAPATIGDKGLAMGGAGETGASPTGATPTSSPGSGGEGNRFASNVPDVTAQNVTPWQAAINTAMMCVAAAALLLYAIKMTKNMPGGIYIAYLMSAIAAALGAYVIYLGSLIGGNFYGQKLQGQMFEVAGTFIIAAAASAAMDMKAAQDGPTGLMMLSGAAALGATAMAYLSPTSKYPASDFKNGLAPDYDYKATDFKGRTN